MSELAINVQGLSKEYHIGINKSGSFRESFNRRIKRLIGEKNEGETFRALKDISFEVKKGEAVGIIGKNGAGKSTLLKILSRITEPTKGRIEINGRVSSLLEVGTGFHPELTGRENIYLNGTILGMTRKEVKNKFDEIVEFSGVEKFIDTPVKHYSSGMKVRLAFSVAAHLEPEILIIDEVLAVGDAEFQRKCLGKMEDVTGQGRTVLFVSHNMGAVKVLCTEGILLKEGHITNIGQIGKIIEAYLFTNTLYGRKIDLENIKRVKYNGILYYSSIQFKTNRVPFGETIEFILSIKSKTVSYDAENIEVGINVQDNYGNCLIHCMNNFIKRKLMFNGESTSYRVSIDNNLRPGNYRITLFLRLDGLIQDWLKDFLEFEILDGNPYNFSNSEMIQGKMFPKFDIQNIDSNYAFQTKA